MPTLRLVAQCQALKRKESGWTGVRRGGDLRRTAPRSKRENVLAGLLLCNEVDLDSVRADLLDVVHDTVRPAHASVWLRERARGGP